MTEKKQEEQKKLRTKLFQDTWSGVSSESVLKLLENWEAYTEATKKKLTVDSPPGKIQDRVFIGGNYVLMPILREIASIVGKNRFVPLLACDFEMPEKKIREYTLRLLAQCRFQIIEITIAGGEIVEIERAKAFVSSANDILLLYMARDEGRSPPPTVSIMTTQDEPQPQGYLTIAELRELVETFLLMKRSSVK